MASTLRDILELPDIKLVVELDDVDRNAKGIIDSFILTPEVEDGLKVILKRIEDNKGCGVFIKGNFGSGKSHFLSYLFLLLKEKSAEIVNHYPSIKGGDFKLVKISLVRYPSSRSLEDIVLSGLSYMQRKADRDQDFREIVNKPTVIIIDELSEFLRSKPSPSSFYEDIRFLQFLGEFSFHHPLWIASSLQEWIEETGHISSDIFNRIKDRYPVRISLSSSHIEDIIDRRVILKKPGAERVIAEVYSELKRYYPNLVMSLEDFRKTYPLHPFTVRYLSGLRPIFSQHRGVIQFVYKEVSRILSQPADMLITPDSIFDHFEERIREIPEYSPFVRVVYDYYNAHLDELFSKPQQRDIALCLIRLMILTEISPLEKRKTAREFAEMSLKKISTLTSEINYDFIRNAVLEPLAAHQMYIRKEQETYFIDASVDEGIRIKGQIKKIKERFENRGYLFTEMCGLTSMPHLPLKELHEGRRYRVSWQNSIRDCVALLCQSPLMRQDIERMLQALERRVDGYMLILSPFQDTGWIGSLKDCHNSPFLGSMLFWTPRGLKVEELSFIEDFAAKNILSMDISSLASDVKKYEAEFREVMTKLYFEGAIVYGDGRSMDSLMNMGLLPIEKLLAHLLDYSLSKVHPEHFKIMSRMDYVSTHNLEMLFNHFIRNGKITIEDSEKKGLLPYIKGLLEPMGLVSKKGGGFHINLDPSNEIVSQCLNIISREEGMTNLTLSLKKGKWGMTEDQIHLLLSAFIVSGQIIPYNRDEPIELKELSQLSSGGITRLCRGKVITPDLLSHIQDGRFIWGEVEDMPTPLTQKAMWKEAQGFIRKARKAVDDLNNLISRHSSYTIFKKTALNAEMLNRLSVFLNSITLTLTPSEGIQRVLLCLKEYPDMRSDIALIDRLERFFAEEFQHLNKYYIYLTHPALRLSGGIEEKRQALLIRIEELLSSMRDDFHEIRQIWEDFFELFISAYQEHHETYYESEVFRVRRHIEETDEGILLKRISRNVTCITFAWDWWQIRAETERLPELCNADLGHELFSNPVCRCGYKIGDVPPVLDKDYVGLLKTGIMNFIKALQLPENKEKLDSCLLGMAQSGMPETAKRLSTLINTNIEKASLALIHSLLTEDVLLSIENAFKGRWKIRELKAEEFFSKIRGRRFRTAEIKDLFNKWLGSEEDSIIHVIDEDSSGAMALKEEFAKYGNQGERVYLDLCSVDHHCRSIEDLEHNLIKSKALHCLDSINLGLYKDEELLDFLQREKIALLKKRIRSELFYRLKDKRDDFAGFKDEVLRDTIQTAATLSMSDLFKGVEVFTKIIAPVTYWIGRLYYVNSAQELIDNTIIEGLDSRLQEIMRDYTSQGNRLDGARDMAYLKETVRGIVIIFDGLRYDLWFMLKGMIQAEGFKIAEEAVSVPTPATTEHFRRSLGIEDEGIINNKSYALIKWAELDTGKRRLKRFLKGSEDVRFLHLNFIDMKVHGSTLDLHPLFMLIRDEFKEGIMPILREMDGFYITADHGFSDTRDIKERYTHGRGGPWETILPFAYVFRRGLVV